MNDKFYNDRIAERNKIREQIGELGKIPPQNIELEEAILGCLLLEGLAYLKICDIITSKSFYKTTNQTIFESIARLYKNSSPIDILTVIAELKTEGKLEEVGGPYRITMLTNRISSSENIEYWAFIVQEMFLKREMIRICTETLDKAYDDTSNYFDILNDVQSELVGTIQQNKSHMRHVSDVSKEVIKIMKSNSKSENPITGIPTGFADLDRATGGFQKGDLIIISGETSNGKTSLALNITQNAAIQKHKVGVWSYEMSDTQLTARLMASCSGVSSKSILLSKLTTEEIASVVRTITPLLNSEIFIEKAGSNSYDKLEAGIRSAVIRNGIEIAFIDYLQLVRHNVKGMSKVDSIAEIANSLKNLAHSLNIPIVLLSQLARDKENPKPSIGRLKGSGDIENAADVILFVWQPSNYKMQSFDCAGQGYQSEGLAHAFIDKGRNIGKHEFVLRFNKELTLFTDYDYINYEMQPNNNFDYQQYNNQ